MIGIEHRLLVAGVRWKEVVTTEGQHEGTGGAMKIIFILILRLTTQVHACHKACRPVQQKESVLLPINF